MQKNIHTGVNRFIDINNLLQSALATIDKNSKSDDSLTGRATGYTELDEKTSGLQKGELIIVAGRPSMGKSTFSMNIAEHIAINDKCPVAIFGMKMPAKQLVFRMLASIARVRLNDICSGNISEEDWSRVSIAVKTFSQSKIFIDDSLCLRPDDIRQRTHSLIEEHGDLGLVVIDDIQSMRPNTKKEKRAEEIDSISNDLKVFTHEMNCPVIALSQLTRSLEERPNKRPIMCDLDGSGAIDQDADTIIFIYRDEVYNWDTPDKGMAEAIIGKHRNSITGTVRLSFKSKFARFDNFIKLRVCPR